MRKSSTSQCKLVVLLSGPLKYGPSIYMRIVNMCDTSSLGKVMVLLIGPLKYGPKILEKLEHLNTNWWFC